jgi:hypothetical protein
MTRGEDLVLTVLGISAGGLAYLLYTRYSNDEQLKLLASTPHYTVNDLYNMGDQLRHPLLVKLNAIASTGSPIEPFNIGSYAGIIYELKVLRRDEVTTRASVKNTTTNRIQDNASTNTRDVLVHDVLLYSHPFCLVDHQTDPKFIHIDQNELKKDIPNLWHLLRNVSKRLFMYNPIYEDYPLTHLDKFTRKLSENSHGAHVEILSDKLRSGSIDTTQRANQFQTNYETNGDFSTVSVRSTGEFIVEENILPNNSPLLVLGQVSLDHGGTLVLKNVQILTNWTEQDYKSANKWKLFGSIFFGGASVALLGYLAIRFNNNKSL